MPVRRLLSIAAVAVVALGLAGSAILLLDGGRPGSDKPIGRSAFEFELRRWRCGYPRVTAPGQSIEALGEFCVVRLDVSNVGDGAGSLDPYCQFLVGEREDERFSTHPGAMALDQLAVAGFGEEIVPGDTVGTALFYDVDVRTQPTGLELHEDCLEAGIGLSLGAEARRG